MSQTIRVPSYLDEQTEKSEELLESYKTSIIQNNTDIPTDKLNIIRNISFDATTRKDMILTGLLDKERFNKFCRILEEKVWIAFYNCIRNEMPFVTSDNPVIFADIGGTLSKITKLGIVNKRMVILFPISPSIIVGIYSPDLFFGTFKEYDGKRIDIDDVEFLIDINTKIIAQSYTHSFLPEPLFSKLKKEHTN